MKKFTGVLAFCDELSTKNPTGARGKRVILSLKAAEEKLDTLVGTLINTDNFISHNVTNTVGVITEVIIVDNAIMVGGDWYYKGEYPSDLGMSYEIKDAYIPDMNAPEWLIERFGYFEGAAVLLRDRASYKNTSFVVHD